MKEPTLWDYINNYGITHYGMSFSEIKHVWATRHLLDDENIHKLMTAYEVIEAERIKGDTP